MRSKSLSLAKLLLGLSIAIALTSFYLGKDWKAQASALKGTVTQQERKLKDAQEAHAELSELLKEDANLVSLENALSQAMLSVFNNRVAHDISISYASPGKLGGGSSMSQISELSEAVPGTKIKSVRINLTGTYATYDGLVGYLKAIQKGPTSVVRLKVQDHAFEVSLRVYGNE